MYTLTWTVVPFIANFIYGIYVNATQIDESKEDSCSKMRDVAQLSSVIAIVLGLLNCIITALGLYFVNAMYTNMTRGGKRKKRDMIAEHDPLISRG